MKNYLYCWLLLVSSVVLGPAYAANKIALVVGNDNYQNVVSLQKAVNDARTISQTLAQLGFEVILTTDTTRRKFNQKLQQFTSKIEAGDIAMLYYAGHSIEINGQNFLLPVDIPQADPGQEDFVKSESVGLQAILSTLRTKKAKLNIVMLDACRNNPFARSGNRGIGGTRGLAGVNPPQGTFVLYSADAGETALDRLSDIDIDPNSIFTRILVPMMLEPELNLPAMAREVRIKVKQLAKTVSHDQTPAYYDAFIGNFYFTEKLIVNQSNVDAPTAKTIVTPSNDYEKDFWGEVKATPSKEMYQAYLAQYPNGHFARIAKIKLEHAERNKPTSTQSDVQSSHSENSAKLNGTVALDRSAPAGGEFEIEIDETIMIYGQRANDCKAAAPTFEWTVKKALTRSPKYGFLSDGGTGVRLSGKCKREVPVRIVNYTPDQEKALKRAEDKDKIIVKDRVAFLGRDRATIFIEIE